MLMLAVQLALAVVFGIGYALLWPKSQFYGLRRIARSFAFGLNIQILATFISIFFLNKYPYRWVHAWTFYAKYLLFSLGLAVVIALVEKLLSRWIHLALPQKKPRAWQQVLWALLGALLLGACAFFFFIPNWFHNYFGTLTPDQFQFLLTGGNGNGTADSNAQVANFLYAPVFLAILLGWQVIFLNRRIYFGRQGQQNPLVDRQPEKVETAKVGSSTTMANSAGTSRLSLRHGLLRGSLAIVSVAALVASIFYAFKVLPLQSLLKNQMNPSTFIEEHYVEPSQVVTFPEKKRNFIHIYMESIENSFFGKEQGGYAENLMPDLAGLYPEGISFSNRDHLFGGPHQTFGSPHSVASMINMGAGIPMKTAAYNGTAAAMLYPDFTTTGDLLHAQGYNNEIMLCADASWGALGDYYRDHGKFKVFDHQYALDNGYLPAGYKVWWGFEDDKLYAFAKDELTRLAQEDKPFYFILENADTHFPDGYVSPLMKDKPFDKQYANVIHYSQAEVTRFVRWIQQQPFYENTTILITGDHRSMDHNFFKGWDPAYERTIVNLFLNSAVAKPADDRLFNREFAPFDLFTTSLVALGAHVEGDRAGLGTNLFSDKKTLNEQFSWGTIDQQLARPSSFFSTHRTHWRDQ